MAVLSMISASYLIHTFYGDCAAPDTAMRLLSTTIAVALVALNCTYVKYVARMQNFLTALKIGTVGLICIVGFIQLGKGKTSSFQNAFEGSNWNVGSIALAVYSGWFTYGGWDNLYIIMEELKKPNRNAPLAAVLSITGVTMVNVIVNISYFTALTPLEVVHEDVVAFAFARRTLGWFSFAIPICVSLCTIGALNSYIMASSRVQFAAARDGLLPGIIGMIHVKFRTPWISLILVCFICLVYIWIGDALSLIEYMGFVGRATNTMVLFCILYLRWTSPHQTRPVKSPLALTLGVFIINVCLLVTGLYQDPRRCGVAVALYFSGIPVYLIYVKVAKKSQWWNHKEGKLNLLSQKILLLIKASSVDSR